MVTRTRTGGRRRGHAVASNERRVALLLVAPALLLALVLKYYPFVLGVIASLHRWQGVGGDRSFVGLENYQRLISDPTVRSAFWTAAKMLATMPIWLVGPLIIATLIHTRPPGWKVFRTIYFIPYPVAPVIVGLMFREILRADGPVNAALSGIGLEVITRPWLSDPGTALWALNLVVLWAFFGLGVLVYLAGLTTVPDELVEAARIDGAGFWSRLRFVIVPLILPVMGFWAIIVTGGMLLWMFPFVLVMTEGGPGTATMLPEYLIYLTSFRFVERGFGSAIGIALFALVVILMGIQVRYMFVAGTRNREGGE